MKKRCIFIKSIFENLNFCRLLYYFIGVALLELFFDYLYLLRPNIVKMFGHVSAIDIILYTGYKTLPYVLIPVVMVFFIAELKEEFSVATVIRRKNLSSIWNHCCFILAIYSFLFALWIILTTMLSGILLTDSFNNWNSTSSFAFHKMNTIPAAISPFYLLFTLFISAYASFFVMGIVLLCVWWLLKTPYIGFMLVIGISFLEGCQHVKGIFIEKYIFNLTIYFKGIHFYNQIFYPISICLILYVLSLLFIRYKKREFLD